MALPIFGPTRTTLAQALAWMDGRGAHQRFKDVAPLYYLLAPLYEIPAENALGQASWETNDGHYTGQVPPEYHNWCGLKTKDADGDDPEDHFQFPNDEQGVEAHLQHLCRYGKRPLPPGRKLLDPRWHLVTKFTTTMRGLGGSWAPSPTYGERVETRIQSLLETEAPMSAQIPGFLWVEADADHYERGRSQKIRGGAQHYTAGTNSLSWLTRTSEPEVSAHFLVKHAPTLHDRGWQLVRIEDTAWTTSKANPYTVSIEYEHTGGPVSHEAYVVLAQCWIDIAAYVQGHGLGEILLNRDGIKGHREWVGGGTVCPDGIDVDTLVGVIHDLLQTPQEPVEAPRITTTIPEPGGEANPWHTGYWVPVEFAAYIERHGFMTVGYAVSEAFMEDGLIVQYFERARLEIHPGQIVMAGLVGAEALWARYPNRRPPVRA